MASRIRSRLAELLVARNLDASVGRVARARRGLLVAASVILAVLFLNIRLESFELSGVEVFVHEEWRFLFLLLVLDAYFLVNYYAVALAEIAHHGHQTTLPGMTASRLAHWAEDFHAYLPFVIGYGAALWLIIALWE